MAEMETIPFVLGMFTVSGSPAFPVLVLDDEAAISIDAIAPLAARLGYALSGTQSLESLLGNWDYNFEALRRTVLALNDAQAGKYFRSAFTAIEFLTPCAPIAAPRQILCEITGARGVKPCTFTAKLASTLVGPKAKIHLPKRANSVVAEGKIGVVLGRPIYQATVEEAFSAIAGYVTVTDISLLPEPDSAVSEDWLVMKSHPSFLPTGPYFVPAAFAGKADALDINIAINGERTFPGNISKRAETLAQSIAGLSQTVQFFPGDLVCCGMTDTTTLRDLPPLGDGDIVETAVSGLGQQTLNAMRTSQ